MLAVLKAALSMLAALGNALGLYLQQKQAAEARAERKEEHNEAQSTADRIANDPAAEWLREFGPSAGARAESDHASAEANKAGT